MFPYDNYRLYQTQRPKSVAEMRHADRQAGEFAAAASGLLRSITLPGRAARASRRSSQSYAAAQCCPEPAVRC
ncbi:MAG TPA: hypothetical protein VMA72_06660 [Streptosporangiaceae bacterium]|nr:hypothetical protein [Streptosporangiaceae bacterium]